MAKARSPALLVVICGSWALAVSGRAAATSGPAAPPVARECAVGVFELGGPNGAGIGWALEKALKRRNFRVIGGEELAEVGWALGVRPDTPAGVRAIAARLDLAVAITGRVSQGRSATVTVSFQDPSGAEVSPPETLSGRNQAALTRAIEALAGRLVSRVLVRRSDVTSRTATRLCAWPADRGPPGTSPPPRRGAAVEAR